MQQKSITCFISGMHRSGTSFLARALAKCGLSLPDAHIKPHLFNEKGHWENTHLARAGRRLFGPRDRWHAPRVIDTRCEVLDEMRRLLENYDAQVNGSWGWKDPRISVTYRYWRSVLAPERQSRLILAFRHPQEVADSLKARDGFSPELAVRLWERYNEWALWAMDRFPGEVILFNYNASDIKKELTDLCSSLGLNADEATLAECFDPKLYHQKHDSASNLSVYNQLYEHWLQKRGLSRQFFFDRNAAEQGRISPVDSSTDAYPGLPLAILFDPGMVDASECAEAAKGLVAALGLCVQTVSAYTDFKIFTFNPWPENSEIETFLTNHKSFITKVECDQPLPEFQSDRIRRLFDHVERYYQHDVVVCLNQSVVPCRYGWDLPVLQAVRTRPQMPDFSSGPFQNWGIGATGEQFKRVVRSAPENKENIAFIDLRTAIAEGPMACFADLACVDLLWSCEIAEAFEPSDYNKHRVAAVQVYCCRERATVFKRLLDASPAQLTSRAEQLLHQMTWMENPLESYLLLNTFGGHRAFDKSLLGAMYELCSVLGAELEAAAYKAIASVIDEQEYRWEGKHVGPKPVRGGIGL